MIPAHDTNLPRQLFLAAIAALSLLLAACSRPPAEQALRAQVDALQAAVESRDARALRSHLARDFIGPEGMDREGAVRTAQLLFLRNRDVDATLGPLQIEIAGQSATLRFTAAMTGGSGALLPESGQVYDVTTGWRDEDGDWKLLSIDWKPRM